MTQKTLEDCKAEILKCIDPQTIPERESVIKEIHHRITNGAMISYAQNFEDIVLNRIFDGKSKGFYVDVGAFDPYIKSVTCHFYQRGWRGINIDLCQTNISRFNDQRPSDTNICMAIGNKQGFEDFYIQPGTTRSTKLKELGEAYEKRGVELEKVKREVDTLQNVLASHQIKEVDFLSIDVEGAEKDVLEGMDFSQVRPKVILAEATFPETATPNWDDWESILLSNDYRFFYFDGLNRFYYDAKNVKYDEKFALPPNYFDNFVRYDYIVSALAAK